MAEPAHQDDHDDHEETPGYKPPAEKALNDIINQDTEDEALQKYKQALLGADLGKGAVPCEIPFQLKIVFSNFFTKT